MVVKNNARTLVMDLLFADPHATVTIRQFLQAGALFDINENNIRVALTRLSSDQLIKSVKRGEYSLTSKAKEISEPIAHRSNSPRQVRPWTGHYLAVHTGLLGRSDRGALTKRERTLHLNGFREFQPDLFIRPDNLAEDLESTRKRLVATGLDKRAPVFIIQTIDQDHQKAITRIWDKKALEQKYQKMSKRIQVWLAQVDMLELDVAARESLLIGREAIPMMMTDPLLPEPFVDTALQETFFNDVIHLNRVGHELWKQFAETHIVE